MLTKTNFAHYAIIKIVRDTRNTKNTILDDLKDTRQQCRIKSRSKRDKSPLMLAEFSLEEYYSTSNKIGTGSGITVFYQTIIIEPRSFYENGTVNKTT